MTKSLVALDVGEKRIGVAHTPPDTLIAFPFTTLQNDDEFWAMFTHLIDSQKVAILVVGLPRGLSGQETAQTESIYKFCAELKKHTNLPVHLQDEAATSIKAREALEQTGKPYEKEAVDALAASYILQDFIENNRSLVQDAIKK